jgi:hypothetical protein
MAARQSPSGGSRPLPIGSRPHRSESPTGYSSTGCSPAEPASASPLTNDCSPFGLGIKCARPISLQRQCSALVFAATQGVISTLRAGCHFYLAPTLRFNKIKHL